jgi:prevent-host-death family protein
VKEKKLKTIKYPPPSESAAMVLKDAVAVPGIGLTFPVRTAKAKLSALLELVASGQEVVITSDGAPKAVLVNPAKRTQRRVFTGTMEHLQKMPKQTEGPFAEEIVRADRDGRGW